MTPKEILARAKKDRDDFKAENGYTTLYLEGIIDGMKTALGEKTDSPYLNGLKAVGK